MIFFSQQRKRIIMNSIQNMKRIQMPMDNHCGYHALLFGLKQIQHAGIDRSKSIQNQILFLKSILIDFYERTGNSRARLLKLHPNEWLNDRDMGILADYFKVCIHVYDERLKDSEYATGGGVPIMTNIGPEPCTQDIYVIQTPNHFDVLLPKSTIVHEIIPSAVSLSKKDIDTFFQKEQVDFYNTEPIVEEEDEYVIPILPIQPKQTYRDIVRRKKVLRNEDVDTIIANRIHEEIFPTWLR